MIRKLFDSFFSDHYDSTDVAVARDFCIDTGIDLDRLIERFGKVYLLLYRKVIHYNIVLFIEEREYFLHCVRAGKGNAHEFIPF